MPTALITGATSGIGAASARALGAAGYRVAITGRRAERLAQLAAELSAAGVSALPLAGDVTRGEDRERWVAETVRAFGDLDVLLNNAGHGRRGPVELVPLDVMRANFETNVFAALGLVQACLPHLRRARPAGRILMVSSVAGRIARPLSSTYDATKHALEAFTDGLRLELRASGVSVVSIMPGFIRTEFAETAARASEAEIAALRAAGYGPLWDSACAAEQRGRRFAADADAVAKVIVKAAKARRPARRYPVPGHAHLLLALRRFLPEALFERFLPR